MSSVTLAAAAAALDRVKQEQELARVVEEAQDFLRPGVEELAEDVRERCQALRTELADEATAALQQAFDDWESKVGELEEYVATQGFQASHQHAIDVVDYALEECQTASNQQLDGLQQFVGRLTAQLQELTTQVRQSADMLADQAGAALTQQLDGTRKSATDAVAALGSVRELLAGYTFVAR